VGIYSWEEYCEGDCLQHQQSKPWYEINLFWMPMNHHEYLERFPRYLWDLRGFGDLAYKQA
jgi:hypothetical protein